MITLTKIGKNEPNEYCCIQSDIANNLHAVTSEGVMESTKTKPKNGDVLIVMDTTTIYLYDETNKEWHIFA